MQKKLFPILGALILSICVGLILRANHNESKINTDALFAASFPDANGKAQALKQWQGKIIVLNFWATWCPPCREEMPELSALNTQYKDKNVVFLGLATDDIGLVQEFSKETKISYPLLAADMAGNDLAFSLGNTQDVLPYTVIIKADGTVAKTYFGRLSMPALEDTIKKLL